MRDGYVRLYRSLLDDPLMNQLPAAWFRIFIAILLRVNWKPGTWWDGNSNVTIPPGTLVTSVEKLSKIAGTSAKQTRNCLTYLKTANVATIKTTTRYSVITLLDWESYQGQQTLAGESEGKPEGKPGAKSGQSEGEVGATIESGNKGIKESGKNNPTDASLASQNGAKTSEYTLDLAQTSNRKPKHAAEDRNIVALAMARYMDPIGRTPVRPPSGIVDEVLAGLGNCTVQQFCRHLGTQPAVYRPGGNKAPKTFRWFITVAQNLANDEPAQAPTDERCKHGKPFGSCCNDPETHEAMTDSFDPDSDYGLRAGIDVPFS